MILLLAPGIIAFYWSKLLGVPWYPATLLGLAAGAALQFFLRDRDRASPRRTLAILLAFVALFALRMLPLDGPVPPGGDMSMHTLLARVATENRVLPATQLPLYPGVPYGAYPLGFHALVATLALGDPGHISFASRLAIALTHTLLGVSLFWLLRRWCRDGVALFVAFAVLLLARGPQAYIGWGGHPTVLGLVFATAALAVALELGPRASRSRSIGLAGLVAATALSHLTIALVLAILLSSLCLWRLVRGGRGRGLQDLLLGGAVSLLLVLPLLVELHGVGYSAEERGWVADNHLSPPQSPAPSLQLVPDYLDYVFGDGFLIAMALTLGVLAYLRAIRLAAWTLGALFVVPHLLVLFRHSGWPGSLELYPERAMLFLLPFSAAVMGSCLERLVRRWGGSGTGSPRLPRALLVVYCAGLTAGGALNYGKYYARPARSSVMVSPCEDTLFWRVAETVGDRGIVANSPFDAASLLPGVYGVACTAPQYNPVWWEELRHDLASRPVVAEFVELDAPAASAGAGEAPDALLCVEGCASALRILATQP